MTAAWLTVGVLAAGTAAIKSAGPAALGGRELPRGLARVVALLAPSLLAALVMVETFTTDRTLVVDARLAGLLAAAAALALRLPIIVVVVAAAAATAVVRALS